MKQTASARKGLAVFSWAKGGIDSRKFQRNTLFYREHKAFLISKKLRLLP
jgi:hypothetical protein